MQVTEEQLDAIFAGLAQGVINIAEGLTTIEAESRIHRAMSALCELRNEGRIVLAKKP